MQEYFKFVWASTIHPADSLDILAPIQLVLAVICWIYIIKSFILIYKHHKHGSK